MRQDLYTTYWKDALPTMKYRSVADAIDNLPKSWKGVKHVKINYYDGDQFKCSVILGNTNKVAYKPLFYGKEDSNKLVENNRVNNGIHVVCINIEAYEVLETPSNEVLETLYYLACSSLHALGKYTEYTDVFCNTPINIDTDGNALIRDSTKETIAGLIKALQ